MSFGVDYAFKPHPMVAALQAKHVKFVGRYVSTSGANDLNGKNLIPAEKAALHAAGISIILYFETVAGRMLGGKSAGIADARHFDAVVKALGMDGAVMICACDFDASNDQQTLIDAYLVGVASVLGRARTWIYGGFWPVTRALNHGTAAGAVQTYAWSSYTGGALPSHAEKWDVGGREFLADKRAAVRQSQIINIGGAACDHLTSFTADYGQWPRPKPPPSGPFRHVVAAGNVASLHKYATDRGTTVDQLHQLATGHLNAINLAVFEAYLALSLAATAAGIPEPAMPEGMVYYTLHP